MTPSSDLKTSGVKTSDVKASGGKGGEENGSESRGPKPIDGSTPKSAWLMRSERFVDWTIRHGRMLWVIAILLAIPATWRTVWLYAHLRSDLEELLPREAPSVIAIDEFRGRVVGRQYLGVVVDAATTENVPAAEHFLDDLAARVRAYPPELVAAVRTGNEIEHAFLDANAPLYMDTDDLKTVHDRIVARKDFEVSRETGALLDDDAVAPSLDFQDIETKYKERLGHGATQTAGRAGDRYTDHEKHLSVLLIEIGGYSSGDAARKTFDHVKVDVDALGGPAKYAPGMRVGYAGDATIAVEEMSALVSDLSISSIIVIFAVMGAIVLYYRWWRSVFIVVPPLLFATVYSFGAASLPPFSIAAVNSNTAFLASIIVGNGINFALILLARYVEERRAGVDVRTSLARAIDGTRGGTLAAAVAAGVSYGSLAMTQFRGFRQFGFIGGFGMLFAWLAAFILMPPLVAWLDHGESTRPAAKREGTRFSYWISRLVAKAPIAVTAITLVMSLVAVVEVAQYRSTDLETDFSRLRRRDTWTSGEGYWGAKMNSVLGEYLTPLVFMTDSEDEARTLATRLRGELDNPPFAGRIERVRTIEDVVPRDQPAKRDVIAQIREDLTPKVRGSLTESQRNWVDRFSSVDERPITPERVPRTFLTGLRERDGSLGKMVLVYPNVQTSWWDGEQMRRFVDALRTLGRDSVGDRPAPRLAGALPLSSDIVDAIRRDGPLASACAFAGVVVVVLALLRRKRAALYVIGSLVVGVLFLAGASRLFHVRINFANFIAFPITFGIGVDYAVNVVSRYEQDGGVDVLAAVRSTGAAVALCSLTTIIGYSSLLMAQNQALFLFGLLAVLGEVSCLTVAVVSMPALILVLRQRALKRSPAALPSVVPVPRSSSSSSG